METLTALQFGGWASLVAFQKLYVYKDYPKMDPYQQYVMEAVYQNPNTPVAVHLKWFDGSLSSNEYTYRPKEATVEITSDNSFLFSNKISGGASLKTSWQDWVKKPEKLLSWQLWPAKIYRIRVLSTPATLILADDSVRESKEPPFSCQDSEILEQTCQLQKVRNKFQNWTGVATLNPIDISYAKKRYEFFLETIAWSIYQRVRESQGGIATTATMVLFVKQLFFYLRAQNVDYDLTSHFWLEAFGGPNGIPRPLNCLGITSLLCAIMECFGYFPEMFSCRIVEGHAMLVYRRAVNQPWQDLELSVPNDKTLNWLGRCEWFNYSNRQNYVIGNAQELTTAMAYNCLSDIDPRISDYIFGQIAPSERNIDLLKPFLIPKDATIHQKVAAEYFIQRGRLECVGGAAGATGFTEADFQLFLEDFRRRPNEYLPGYVIVMFLCENLWRYIQSHLDPEQLQDLYAKLRQNEYFTSPAYMWQIRNPLHKLLPGSVSENVALLQSWRSHLTPDQLKSLQKGWSMVWDTARKIMGELGETRKPSKLLTKRKAESSPTAATVLPKIPRLSSYANTFVG